MIFTRYLHHCYHLTCTSGISRETFKQISKSGFVICSGLFSLHQWRLLKRLHQHSAVNQCPSENDWLHKISDEGVNLLCDKFACYVQSLGDWLSCFWKHFLYTYQASVSSIKYYLFCGENSRYQFIISLQYINSSYRFVCWHSENFFVICKYLSMHIIIQGGVGSQVCGYTLKGTSAGRDAIARKPLIQTYSHEGNH